MFHSQCPFRANDDEQLRLGISAAKLQYCNPNGQAEPFTSNNRYVITLLKLVSSDKDKRSSYILC